MAGSIHASTRSSTRSMSSNYSKYLFAVVFMSASASNGSPVRSGPHYEQAMSIFRIASSEKPPPEDGTGEAGSPAEHKGEHGLKAEFGASKPLSGVVPIIGIVVACLVAAIVVGFAVEFVVRHISDDDAPTNGQADSSINESQANHNDPGSPPAVSYNRSSSKTCSDISDETDSGPRGSSYYFDKDKGVWSMRGLSATGGASSVGHPLYNVVEDGCADASLRTGSSSQIRSSEEVVEHTDLGSSKASPWFENSH